jgi:hypothetical protein
MGFLASGKMVVARILVSLNNREGLREFLNLIDLRCTRVQILDYEGVPFYCRRCHEYDHVVKDYLKYFRRCLGHSTHEVMRQGREHQDATREFSSSSVSNSVGPPSPTPASLQDSSTTDQLESFGDALALIPTIGDEACTEHSP